MKEKCWHCKGIRGRFRRKAKYSLGRDEIDPWDNFYRITYARSCKKHLPKAIASIREEGNLVLHVIESREGYKDMAEGTVYLLCREEDVDSILGRSLFTADYHVQIYKDGEKVGHVDEQGNVVFE